MICTFPSVGVVSYNVDWLLVVFYLPFFANESAETFPIPLLAPVIMYDRLEGSKMCMVTLGVCIVTL